MNRPCRASRARHRPGQIGLMCLSLALLGLGWPAAAATFIVGPGGAAAGCTHASVVDAVFASLFSGPGPHTILIASNQNYTSQAIAVGSTTRMTLIGGYADCAASTSTGTTQLSGAGGAPAPVVEAVEGTIELVNLRLIGGEQGGLEILPDAVVFLQNANVDSNDNDYGGGVVMDGGVLSIDEDSGIGSNQATVNGGGIHCSNGGNIGLFGAVEGNLADGSGAGIYLDDCNLNAFGSTNSRISDNTALIAGAGSGGGIYAANGAFVNLVGDGSHAVEVANNRTALDGGGIYLTGSNTSGALANSSVRGNFAKRSGAGLAVTNAASLFMDRDVDACDRGVRCSHLTGNAHFSVVGIEGRGAAIAAWAGGQAEIRQTFIDGNDASDSAVFLVEGAGSSLILEGAMITENGPGLDLVHFAVNSGAFLRLAYVSTKNNLLTTQHLIQSGTSGDIEIFSSVFGESAGELFDVPGPGALYDLDCLVVHEAGSLPAAVGGVLRVEPDPNQIFSGGLQLGQSSPAVDLCDTFRYVPLDEDIEMEARGVNEPGAPDVLGLYDAGADELVMLFGDDFESGDTSRWSITTP